MMQMEMMAVELEMKEQRVAYWEKNHELPGCKEMVDCFDNQPAMI